MLSWRACGEIFIPIIGEPGSVADRESGGGEVKKDSNDGKEIQYIEEIRNGRDSSVVNTNVVGNNKTKMELKTFIESKSIDRILLGRRKLSDYRGQNEFNLFTLSSYNSYLENFHSDVIAALLNPEGKHGQGDLFLRLFIQYLNIIGGKISYKDYETAEITREKGRIDIWVKDPNSNKSIIIENKINNAVDQENQIENYYDYAVNAGYTIDVIIYLSLDGKNTAPFTMRSEIDNLIINIPTYNNDGQDLHNGWLMQGYLHTRSVDASSFIIQYSKLLQHLSKSGMNKNLQDEFYQLIGSPENYEKAQAIVEMTDNLLIYRADLIGSRLGEDYLPFRKRTRYRPNHWLFMNYTEGPNNFKLDIYFLNDGSARIDFWNPNKNEEETLKKIKFIGLESEFSEGGFGGGFMKIFPKTGSNSIPEIDDALFRFLKIFLKALR